MATAPTYFSRYGGLWIDRRDFEDALVERQRKGEISKDEADQVRFFEKNGYLILPGAVPASACDRFECDIAAAWERGDERLLIQNPTEYYGKPLAAGAPRVQTRVVDSYVYYESALDLLLSDSIARFMRIIFDDAPLLFQSLSFEMGSEGALHQDTGYVVVNSPMELAATWIALEDVREGSGELIYIPGSHRMPEFHFSGEFKHWSEPRDGAEQQQQWIRLLGENAERMGLRTEIFRPQKGDALIWAADLAHGGSPIQDRSLTRRSLVGHFCPNRAEPNYFAFRPDRRTKGWYRNGYYSSSYYEIPQPNPPQTATPESRKRKTSWFNKLGFGSRKQ
ncbi:MAG: phytanoyl-CoA dioxygenase family protein [Acidobacteriaceae bacterium]|nr:phytanoyl-CoA dioxygenase family protein [Acidobacteriaceae bacterium]